MNSIVKFLAACLSLAAVIAVVILMAYAFRSMGVGSGLAHYFARLGIEVNFPLIIIVIGLIPVAWLIGFIIKTWS